MKWDIIFQTCICICRVKCKVYVKLNGKRFVNDHKYHDHFQLLIGTNLVF